MTAITRYAFWPPTQSRKTLVDPVAFTLALFAAPIITGVLGAPMMLIPSIASLMGGPAFVVIGGPLLWRALRQGQTTPGEMAALAVKTIVILALLGALTTALLRDDIDHGNYVFVTVFFSAFAIGFAALWASIFAALYAKLRHPHFPKSV